MNSASLLIELLTEELPPKALKRLGSAFAETIVSELKRLNFVGEVAVFHPFMTPRRLAVVVENVLDLQPDQAIERKGPAIASAYDAEGNPTKALEGFLRSCQTTPDALATSDDGRYLVFSTTKAGEPLDAFLTEIVDMAAKKLPVPKLMRWGSSDDTFVRPVHGLILMHGSRVIPGRVLGQNSRADTRGHRFLGLSKITISSADDYERQLEQAGAVIGSFDNRRQMIVDGLKAAADQVGGGAYPMDDDTLLDEVTGLVEYPAVYVGSFDDDFLAVPQECLILSMTQHQKYFPLLDANGNLLPKFLVVSNMAMTEPTNIVSGNERVIHARLSDARFFYEQDIKTPLEARLPALEHVVYHNRLGSQLDRIGRLRTLATTIAKRQGLSPEAVDKVDRAAMLCKADLVCDMVGEFPELQGTMGRYYALAGGESPDVAFAIEQHYWPRFSGDRLPENEVAVYCALADRLDILVGIFGIGLIPTGDKDPFALRRHALAVLRILIDNRLGCSIRGLLEDAQAGFLTDQIKPGTVDKVCGFMLERLKFDCVDRGFSVDIVEAVLSLAPDRIDDIVAKLEAVKGFLTMPEAASLTAANKRIVNILKKNPTETDRLDEALLVEAAEKALHQTMVDLTPVVAAAIDRQDFTEALSQLAALKAPIDAFFDAVMVIDEDEAVRNNRLALLKRLAALTNGVADLSRLSVTL